MHHKITILGHLGKDPDQRFTPSGKCVTNFSVATNRNWTDNQGRKRETTLWFKITCWGRMAETSAEFLSKGDRAFIEGYLTGTEKGNPRIWTGHDGIARAQFEVTATFIKFLGSSGSGRRTWADASEVPDEEEEIPF